MKAGVLALAFGFAAAGVVCAQQPAPTCSMCATWNTPQKPFRIYGNTYYVGPHGLAAILITSPAGDVLIDGALRESAPLIAANIRELGFKLEDVKLILNTHVHHDHAGGIAELQRLTGARVVASPWSAAVLRHGGVAPDDPQLGELLPIEPVAHVEVVKDSETLHVGSLAVTAHSTAGHTPGGTSWTWDSCEGTACEHMVYADSLSAVSAPGFRFSASTAYPHALGDFAKSISWLRATPCDILLTPHGEASDFWAHMEAHRSGASPDPLIDPGACRRLADTAEKNLAKRLLEEGAGAKGQAPAPHL